MSRTEIILKDFHNLLNEPYYVDLIKEYPQMNLVYLQLRRDIVEQKNSDFKLNDQTFNRFYEIFTILKKNIADKETFRTEYYQKINEAYQLSIGSAKMFTPWNVPLFHKGFTPPVQCNVYYYIGVECATIPYGVKHWHIFYLIIGLKQRLFP